MRDDLDIPMPAMGPAMGAGYRVPRHEGMDPNTKRLALIAGSIGGALLVLFGAWTITGHRRAAGVPVVEADSRPLRVKPANPGGMAVTGQNESILSGKVDDKAALAPAPEAPAPEALKAQERQAAAAAAAATAAAALAAAHPPAPTAAPAPRVVQARPALPPIVATPAVVTQSVAIAEPHPMPKPAAPPAKSAATPTPPAAVGGVHLVQLAAVGSEQAAMAEWQRLEKRMPEVLAGRKPAVAKVERDGKTFWRLRTGGFAGAAQAGQFCERVKSKGAGCAVTNS